MANYRLPEHKEFRFPLEAGASRVFSIDASVIQKSIHGWLKVTLICDNVSKSIAGVAVGKDEAPSDVKVQRGAACQSAIVQKPTPGQYFALVTNKGKEATTFRILWSFY